MATKLYKQIKSGLYLNTNNDQLMEINYGVVVHDAYGFSCVYLCPVLSEPCETEFWNSPSYEFILNNIRSQKFIFIGRV